MSEQSHRLNPRISIRAPTRGATDHFRSGWTGYPNFNPRSHEGSDPLLHILLHNAQNFNPRSHEGSDRNTHQLHQCPLRFQSALPRGERPVQSDQDINVYTLFQSALPRGARRFVLELDCTVQRISIRAPTRGATSMKWSGMDSTAFQSALPRGERRNPKHPLFLPFLFQSALPRGERRCCCVCCWVSCCYFNPRSRVGSDELS